MLDKQELKPILEALIFAADSAIGLDRMAGILEGEERAAIKEALDELVAEYAGAGRGFTIEEVAGGYQYRTNPDYAPYLRRLFKIGLQRISKPAMEALAIVAYKQPVTRAELEAIRGVDSGGVLATLMEKRFIRIVGRKELPGRPVVYGTTKEFLETFDLKDLSCLPSLKDIQKMEEENGAQDALPEEEDRGRDNAAGEEVGKASGEEAAGPQAPEGRAGAGTGGEGQDGRHEDERPGDEEDFEDLIDEAAGEYPGEEIEELSDEAIEELPDEDRSTEEEDNPGADDGGGPQAGAGEAEDQSAGKEDDHGAEGAGEEAGEETGGEDEAPRPAEAPEDNSDGGDSVPEKG